MRDRGAIKARGAAQREAQAEDDDPSAHGLRPGLLVALTFLANLGDDTQTDGGDDSSDQRADKRRLADAEEGAHEVEVLLRLRCRVALPRERMKCRHVDRGPLKEP